MRPETPDVEYTIPDEPANCEYRVRVTFERQPYDPGDASTPPSGGGVELRDADVLEVRWLDSAGDVERSETGPVARAHDARAWELIQSDSQLREQVESACRGESGAREEEPASSWLARWRAQQAARKAREAADRRTG